MNYFKEFRKKHRLTQAEAGALLGLSGRTYHDLDHGCRRLRGHDEPGNQFKPGERESFERLLNAFEQGHWEEINNYPITYDLLPKFRNTLKLSIAEAAVLVGCSDSHWANMERQDKPIADRYRLALASYIWETRQNKQEPVQVEPEPEDLPIAEQTEYLTIRKHEGQKWLTYQDIANGYDVHVSVIKMNYSRHSEEWKSNSQLPHHSESILVELNGKPIRLFSFRGAMRFAYYVESGRAAEIRDHLLDLIEREAQGNQPNLSTNPLDHLKLIVQALEDSQAQVKELKAKIAQVESRIEELPQASPEKAAQATLEALGQLNSHKARLHELVNSIVNQAKALPQDDPEAQYYAQYGNAWRTVHRYARPQVSAKSDYTSVDQINHAIAGAELILTRLGGRVPAQQLAFEGVAV